MAAKYTNEASLIVAQAIIESAQLYVETLEDLKKQIEGCQIEYEQQASAATSAEVSRLQAENNVLKNNASELAHELSQLKESIRQKDVEIASLRQNQFSSEKKPINGSGVLAEIKILSKLQRQLKRERDFKKFRGVTISGSEAQARSLCSRNARRLRALHAVYGMCLGNTYKVTESRWAEESRHPLEDLVYLISQIQAEYGMTPKDPAYASLVPKPSRTKSCKCNHAASGNAATQQQTSNAATQPSGNTAATAAPNDPNAMYGLRISEGYSYQKLQMIKDFKEITGLGLKEAKDKVDNGPILYEGGLDLATANDYVRWMKARGHSLEIFPAK